MDINPDPNINPKIFYSFLKCKLAPGYVATRILFIILESIPTIAFILLFTEYGDPPKTEKLEINILTMLVAVYPIYVLIFTFLLYYFRITYTHNSLKNMNLQMCGGDLLLSLQCVQFWGKNISYILSLQSFIGYLFWILLNSPSFSTYFELVVSVPIASVLILSSHLSILYSRNSERLSSFKNVNLSKTNSSIHFHYNQEKACFIFQYQLIPETEYSHPINILEEEAFWNSTTFLVGSMDIDSSLRPTFTVFIYPSPDLQSFTADFQKIIKVHNFAAHVFRILPINQQEIFQASRDSFKAIEEAIPKVIGLDHSDLVRTWLGIGHLQGDMLISTQDQGARSNQRFAPPPNPGALAELTFPKIKMAQKFWRSNFLLSVTEGAPLLLIIHNILSFYLFDYSKDALPVATMIGLMVFSALSIILIRKRGRTPNRGTHAVNSLTAISITQSGELSLYVTSNKLHKFRYFLSLLSIGCIPLYFVIPEIQSSLTTLNIFAIILVCVWHFVFIINRRMPSFGHSVMTFGLRSNYVDFHFDAQQICLILTVRDQVPVDRFHRLFDHCSCVLTSDRWIRVNDEETVCESITFCIFPPEPLYIYHFIRLHNYTTLFKPTYNILSLSIVDRTNYFRKRDTIQKIISNFDRSNTLRADMNLPTFTVTS